LSAGGGGEAAGTRGERDRPGAPGRVTRLGGDPPSPWEGAYSFSRVVSAAGWVLVGGTTSVGSDGVVLGDTPYEQTIEILRKLEHELGRAGASLSDVVQTRVHVVDISRADEVGRAHGEAFGEVRPLMTMVQVSALIDPRMLVEIEAVALRRPE
jgi:enamine deaminase RidA (YjgF/YER057c/UK114 family)